MIFDKKNLSKFVYLAIGGSLVLLFQNCKEFDEVAKVNANPPIFPKVTEPVLSDDKTFDVVSTFTGDLRSQTLSAQVKVGSETKIAEGQGSALFVVASLPDGRWFSKAGTNNGWRLYDGTNISEVIFYAGGRPPAVENIKIFENADGIDFLNAQIYVGIGICNRLNNSSAIFQISFEECKNEMLTSKRYKLIHTIK